MASNITLDALGLALPDGLADIAKAAVPRTIWDVAALVSFALLSLGILAKPWDSPDPYHHVWFEKPQLKNGGSAVAKRQRTRNIAEHLEQLNKSFVIFWGSQSGTAQGFAQRLEREMLARFSLDALAADLSDYDAATISLIPSSKIAIFLLATFGEGDPSDNAAEFFEWLGKKPSFDAKPFAVFGLGDSNYQHFNRVAVQAADTLAAGGGHPLLPLVRADAAVPGATEEQFLEWKDALLAHLQTLLGLAESTEIQHIPQFDVVEDATLDVMDLHTGIPVQATTETQPSSPIVNVPVAARQQLFVESATTRRCVHLDLDLSTMPPIRYSTGDHLAVWPVNTDDEVERLLSVLGWTTRRHVPVLVRALAGGAKVPVPTPTTLLAMFRHYLEIAGGPVSRDTMRGLVPFAPTDGARAFLEALATDKARYASFVGRHHVTLARLLQHAVGSPPQEHDEAAVSAAAGSWSHLPLSFVLDALPPLHPRLYSISSSSTVAPRLPSITALVVQTPLAERPDKEVPGLASNYLDRVCRGAENGKDADAGQTLHVAIRRSKFHPPAFSTPVIIVGAGTGVAPFRGFVLERAHLAKMGRAVGRTVLFFGCRRRGEDFVYGEEMGAALASLPDGELVPVFSREREQSGDTNKSEQSEDTKKRYVQDALRERGEEISRLILAHGARVYVCGRASMGREVCAAIRQAVSVNSEKLADEKACAEWWERWRRSGGYAEDLWG